MANMKKSGVKKRSARSIELEQQRIAEETAAREAKEKKAMQRAKLMEASKKTMFAMYGFVFSIISWLFDWMGVVATIALVLSIIGIRLADRKEDANYFKAAVVGIVLSVARLAMWAFMIIRYFMA